MRNINLGRALRPSTSSWPAGRAKGFWIGDRLNNGG